MILLKAKWPENALFNNDNTKKTSLWYLEHLDNLNKNVDWKIFANYCKAISILQHNKHLLYEDVLKETFDRIIDDMLDYLFVN